MEISDAYAAPESIADYKPAKTVKRKKTPFTIVELLVVLSVIGILIGMILPAVS